MHEPTAGLSYMCCRLPFTPFGLLVKDILAELLMSVMVLVAALKQKIEHCRNLFSVPSGVGRLPGVK